MSEGDPASRTSVAASLSVRAAFSIPGFVPLLCGRTVSLLGSAIAPIALSFAALDLGASASQLGLVLAARSIPQLAFALFGGVLADRFPRATLLFYVSLLCAATQACAALLVLTGTAALWHLAALEAVNGAASALLFPASSALTPQIVPRALLQTANVILRLALNIALIGGAAAGGLVVATVGPGAGLAADAVTFCVAAIAFGFLRRVSTPNTVASDGPRPLLGALEEGWSAFRSRSYVWPVVLTAGVVNMLFSAGFLTLGPLIADETFGRRGWGLVLAAQAVGLMLGGLAGLRLRPDRPLRLGLLGLFLLAPVILSLGLPVPFAALLLTAMLSGFGVEVFTLQWDLTLQRHVPQDVLSRVYAYDSFGSMLFLPIGQILGGPMALLVGLEGGVVACAIGIGLAASVALATPPAKATHNDISLAEQRRCLPNASAHA